jgi:chemotaxis protein CheD
VQRTIGIGEWHATCDPSEVLVTHSLGSCIGMTVYDAEAGVGGMVHCMLPLSNLDPVKARLQPALYTNLGVPLLLEQVLALGAKRGRLQIKVAGASNLLDEKGMFRIGPRNYMILRKLLWKNDLLITSEDVGGSAPRTLYLYLDSGRTRIQSQGVWTEL